ncbi:hypothetical protein PENARI_c005G09094 [Penicillium arizonense]|uniref:Alpha/beta hydrolase fold-3 domain-containing protein n=1 Tax=Penicillium arizonense TaxID=1835702 RepID=A0A1F5LN81_PENAI|nr:hypothetical protein PENARI_c005G09094 [Penicillium arizonense]OGE54662.1 hypothetical protein PENARI_c005G09094 [Penicillium arizonense]
MASEHLPSLDFDPELSAILPLLPLPKGLTVEMLPALRQATSQATHAESTIAGRPIRHREIDIDGPNGKITLSILEKIDSTIQKNRPGFYYIHGGGRILGNRFSGLETVLEWVEKLDAVCISVEYRLAPEFQGTSAVEECYKGLEWIGEKFDQLGIDPAKLMIAGQSSGGGLAAGIALLTRDRKGPLLSAQLLMCPQLDDQNNTVSSRQFLHRGIWNGKDNALGWQCVLGGSNEVSPYLSPSRATDLTGLPPAYIDVGSAEVFRDEDVKYATRLWESGVQTELHVWSGGYHVFDMMAPSSELARKAIAARTAWVVKLLS